MTSLAEIISRNERLGGRSGGWDEQMDGWEDWLNIEGNMCNDSEKTVI